MKEERFVFEPDLHPYEDLETPVFSVINKDEAWHFTGVEDRDLKDQVEEEINHLFENKRVIKEYF